MANIAKRQHAVIAPQDPPARTPAGDALTDLIVPTIRLHGMFSRAGEEIAKPAAQTLARWLALGGRPETLPEALRWGVAAATITISDIGQRALLRATRSDLEALVAQRTSSR